MKNLEIIKAWNTLGPSAQAADRMDNRFYAALNAHLTEGGLGARPTPRPNNANRHQTQGPNRPLSPGRPQEPSRNKPLEPKRIAPNEPKRIAPNEPNRSLPLRPKRVHPVREGAKPTKKKSWLKFLTTAAVILLAVGLVFPIYKLWQDKQVTKPGVGMYKSLSHEEDGENNQENDLARMLAPEKEADTQNDFADQVECALLDDASGERDLVQPPVDAIDNWTPDPQLEPYNLKGLIQPDSTETEKSMTQTRFASGYGGIIYKDISEINKLNLYEEGYKPTHLPIVVNPFYEEGANSFMEQRIISRQELEAIVEEIAEKHGITILETDLDREDRFPQTEDHWVVNDPVNVVGDPYDIFFDPVAMEYELYFKEPLKLDFENAYKFSTKELAEHPYEELREISLAATEKIMTDFQDLLGFKNPVISEDYNSYQLDGQRMYFQPYIVDLAGANTSEQVVNANFRQVRLLDWPPSSPENYGISYQEMEDNHYLFGFRFNYIDPSNIVGDYPIASLEEALSALEAGYYFNWGQSHSQYQPKAEDVERVELGYHLYNEPGDFLPYYTFYIADQNEQDDGLKTYFIYFVPAIAPDYLQVDGEFVNITSDGTGE